MNKSGRILFFLVLFLAVGQFAEPVWASRPPLKNYTTEEGLAHDSVNRIVRDSHGFLWFCTAEGLSRFDGAAFKNYTPDHGLPNRSVNTFLETREGTFLVGTDSGLAVFNPHGRAYRWNVIESKPEIDSTEPPLFQAYFPPGESRQKKEILNLAQENRTGKIWVGTDNGLFIFEPTGAGEWAFREIPIDELRGIFYSVVSFLNLANGEFLVGTSHGVFQIGVDEEPKRLDKYGAFAMLEDRAGNIWLDSGAESLGLRVFKYENGALAPLRTYTKKDGLPENAFYFALKETSDGRIFIGQHDGLSEFVPGAPANEPRFRVLRSEKVTAIEEDAGGNLWIGSALRGAWKLTNKGFTIYGEVDGIVAADDLRAIYVTPDGKIVLPARPQKSLVLAADGKFVSVSPRELKKRSWSWNFLDILSKDGEWWIPTTGGLFRYPRVGDPADLSRTRPKKIYTTADGLPGDEIFNIFEDSRGDIWFTVVGVENSLLRWERKTDRIVATTAADNLPKYNGPISFAEDAQGGVWFGFYFGGLARYRDGKFDYFTTRDGLPESQITDLLLDSEARLWVATSGQGLYTVDDTSRAIPEFKSFSTADGLSSNQITCLTKDKFERIYAGTGRGINRIDRAGGIRIFSQADGLPSNYITRCAADHAGVLWFVSQNTLLKFTPETDRATVPPPVFIDKIAVNGVAQKISALGETAIRELELTHDQSQIQIDFFALTFGAEANIRYQYKLDEQDWSAPDEPQTVNLNLAPGIHNFQVRAIRSDGVASERSATVSFKILPPVWQRWWFIVLAALFVSGAIVLIYRYRIANLRRINDALSEAKIAEENLRKAKEERLAELEKVRSRIATDLHDDIGASLTQIAVLSEVAQAQSSGNGASESLAKISHVSNDLVEAMSDIVWSINPAKDHLSDLTQRMRRFASDVLSAKGIAFKFDLADADRETIVNTNLRREVFLIFKETVNNIAKHSCARQVKIKLSISGEILTLNIADDGKGFSPENLLENSLSSAADYGGNGIASIRRRAAEMGGRLEIKSGAGKGTVVDLSLPLEPATIR